MLPRKPLSLIFCFDLVPDCPSLSFALFCTLGMTCNSHQSHGSLITIYPSGASHVPEILHKPAHPHLNIPHSSSLWKLQQLHCYLRPGVSVPPPPPPEPCLLWEHCSGPPSSHPLTKAKHVTLGQRVHLRVNELESSACCGTFPSGLSFHLCKMKEGAELDAS